MKLIDIYQFIDSFAPFGTQSPWDNSGILLGAPGREVHKALVCLDLTKEVAAYAAAQGCDLIVSHHPVIFRSLKTISSDSVFWQLIRNEVCVISAHTNLDKAPGGVNDTLCGLLKLDYQKCPEDIADGFLNVGTFEKAMTASETALYLQSLLDGAVRYIDAGRPIKKAAVCCGSGGEFYKEAAALDCDALITGDADHHDFLDAAAIGVSLFAAGHFETETPVTGVIAEKLSTRFPELPVLQYPRRNAITTLS